MSRRRVSLCGMCLVASFGVLVALPTRPSLAAEPPGAVTTQRIILIRHGEKPEAGLGQINCQGLQRALALPAVLLRKFGKPDFVFAPNPQVTKMDAGQPYHYVRPLLTVAPLAVQLGLPINTAFGFDQISELQAELMLPRYRKATVVVAWEHKLLETLTRNLLGEDASARTLVPQWKGKDFDSVYIVTLTRRGEELSAGFAKDRQGLDGRSIICP